MEYKIKPAAEENIDELLSIYRSLIGKDGCTWDLDYPSVDDIRRDINQNSLYIVLDHEEIIAAASAGEEADFKRIDCYSKDIKAPCALSRIAVKTEYQNRGIAKYLIRHIEIEAKKRGFDGIQLLVSKTNPHAKAVYDQMHYVCCGECSMYEIDWYCCEKKL